MSTRVLLELEKGIIKYFQNENISIIHVLESYTRRNIFVLLRNNEIVYLYIKYSKLNPGFWGLDSSTIRLLENNYLTKGYRWMVVLLLGTADEGYLLPRSEVMRCVNNKIFKADKVGQYKVHQQELAPGNKFKAVEGMIARIYSIK